MPSVIATINFIPDSAASRIDASTASGGTMMTVAFAPVAATASAQLRKQRTVAASSSRGETPATMFGAVFQHAHGLIATPRGRSVLAR